MVLLQPYCNRASTRAHAMEARVCEYLDKGRKKSDEMDAMG